MREDERNSLKEEVVRAVEKRLGKYRDRKIKYDNYSPPKKRVAAENHDKAAIDPGVIIDAFEKGQVMANKILDQVKEEQLLHARKVTLFFTSLEYDDVHPIVIDILDKIFEDPDRALLLEHIANTPHNREKIIEHLAKAITRAIKNDSLGHTTEQKANAIKEGLQYVKLHSNNSKLLREDGKTLKVKEFVKYPARARAKL